MCVVKVAFRIEAAGDRFSTSIRWTLKLCCKRLGEISKPRLGQSYGDHLKSRITIFRWDLERSYMHDCRCWYQRSRESYAKSFFLCRIVGTVTPAKLEECSTWKSATSGRTPVATRAGADTTIAVCQSLLIT